ncbi:hypothetical protein Y032_0039g13 [Ancylostoma ceylanicum]|uniref:Uncharacterized protein n=1 Tax=Ancylostoma ceylanicum TaxID=53326 RepID=A0A016UHU5_9BILA|nr:hypothetical protein Y032_0039g13 [Ancylostoma ceylanicum]
MGLWYKMNATFAISTPNNPPGQNFRGFYGFYEIPYLPYPDGRINRYITGETATLSDKQLHCRIIRYAPESLLYFTILPKKTQKDHASVERMT